MKSVVVANWKMNPATFKDAKKLFEATKKAAEKAPRVSVIVAPPAIYLRELRASYKGARIAFAAQNAHFEAGGAYTGDISLAQVKDARAHYVIIGHAERRASGESNDDTRKKVAVALSLGITPILCVGEVKRTASGEHFNVVKEQLRAGFADVALTKVPRVVVAYEPVWAIGADRAMSPRDMHEMSIFVRKTVVETCGEVGHSIKVLYGGSVDGTSIVDMLRNGDVVGFLVGRASADAGKFEALMHALAQS